MIKTWKHLKGAGDSPGTQVYEIVFVRGQYELKAEVKVSAQYPVEAPHFVLSFVSHPPPAPHPVVPGIKVDPVAATLAEGERYANNNLKAIEAEVNESGSELELWIWLWLSQSHFNVVRL